MTPIAIGVIPLESGPAFARAELLDLYRLYVVDQPVNLLLHFLLRQWTGSILTAHGGLPVHEGETPNRHLAGAVRSRGLGAINKLAHLLFGEDTAVLLRKRGQVGGLLLQCSGDRSVSGCVHPMTLGAILSELKFSREHLATRAHRRAAATGERGTGSESNDSAAQQQNGRQSQEAKLFERHLSSPHRIRFQLGRNRYHFLSNTSNVVEPSLRFPS